jgi:hypothetical protein
MRLYEITTDQQSDINRLTKDAIKTAVDWANKKPSIKKLIAKAAVEATPDNRAKQFVQTAWDNFSDAKLIDTLLKIGMKASTFLTLMTKSEELNAHEDKWLADIKQKERQVQAYLKDKNNIWT